MSKLAKLASLDLVANMRNVVGSNPTRGTKKCGISAVSKTLIFRILQVLMQYICAISSKVRITSLYLVDGGSIPS